MWTQFWDMHSGGRSKEAPYNKIYIEAPQKEAIVIFYNRFGHNPLRVTCTCCGEDYSVDEYESLEQATAFHRHCAWSTSDKKYLEQSNDSQRCIPLEEYLTQPDVFVIAKHAIAPEERHGNVPKQGYVWID